MFVLKKILGLVLQPLSLALIALLAGTLLLWRDPSRRTGRLFVTAGLVLLVAISLPILPNAVGGALERSYSAYTPHGDEPPPEFVVVLGGGSKDDATLPLSARLAPVALARLVEGVRIAGLHPSARLVVSGGAVFSSASEAEIAAEVAVMLGVEAQRIVIEPRSRDTAEQARLIGEIVTSERFVLVTSAVHMPRSMKLFRKQGLDPIAAPTAHHYDRSRWRGPGDFLPSAENVRAVHLIMHELYGIAWAEFVDFF